MFPRALFYLEIPKCVRPSNEPTAPVELSGAAPFTWLLRLPVEIRKFPAPSESIATTFMTKHYND